MGDEGVHARSENLFTLRFNMDEWEEEQAKKCRDKQFEHAQIPIHR